MKRAGHSGIRQEECTARRGQDNKWEKNEKKIYHAIYLFHVMYLFNVLYRNVRVYKK